MRVVWIALVILFFSIGAKAAEKDSVWQADKARLENLKSENISDEKRCQETWDILWSWSKRGNLEARATLFMLVYAERPGFPQMFMPGRAGDEVSIRRDAVILGTNSIGVQYADPVRQGVYFERSNELYNSFFKGWSKGDGFLQCLVESSGEHCSHVAKEFSGEPVDKTKLIPSFQEYSQEIDALLRQGMMPTCINFCYDFWNKSCEKDEEKRNDR